MSFINGWWIVYTILAAGTTILFVSGYLYGIVRALGSKRDMFTLDTEDTRHYAVPIGVAVILSAVAIGLAGINPAFVYIGPLLNLVTAGVIGACFFLDKGEGMIR
jgi:uncharacterized membrane protein (UPF0182 family)